MTSLSLKQEFEKYFGLIPGGVDLRRSLQNLPLEELSSLAKVIKKRSSNSRLFFMGNGGSFDNARWMAQLCRLHGIVAKTPGCPDDYMATMSEQGYQEIYAVGLKNDRLSKEDIVIGISGSGNSLNVIRGLEFAATKGCRTFAFGGRDGGRMIEVLAPGSCIIAQNVCMEAIEDLHNFMMMIVIKSFRKSVSLKAAHKEVFEKLNRFLTEDNMRGLEDMGQGMLNAMAANGRVFILGLGIGPNHFRADMGRGVTNTLPIKAMLAPEIFSMNSFQATANDDGPEFVLANGLSKFAPGPRDFAVLCQNKNQKLVFNHCSSLLDEAGTEYVKLGPEGVDIDPFEQRYFDFAVIMVGHACGEVLRQYLTNRFSVRELDCRPDYENEQKKLGMRETRAWEEQLRSQGVIEADEIITFCYGRVYAVKGSNVESRCFF